MKFEEAFARLVDPLHEGGYVNDPNDPGGETKYGISKRAYPEEDIKNLTLDRAAVLYRRDYWEPAGCDLVPDALRYQLFDLAVNTSQRGRPREAVKLLQRAAGMPPVEQDGIIGTHTLMAVQAFDPYRLLTRLQGQAISYYTSIPPERRDRYLAGWMNRLAANMKEA
jgi:lysozyme family protein